MTPEEIKKILEEHQFWLDTSLNDKPKGQRANLQDVNLQGADLRYVNLARANLEGADLRYASLQGASLYGASLQDANLRYANLIGASLYGANLHGADLRHANLQDVNLQSVNLIGADLRYAGLQRANLTRANLRGANLIGADIQYTTGNNKDIVTLQAMNYTIVYTDTVIAIGCEQHTIEWWYEQTPETVAKLAPDASEFWAKWKPTLEAIGVFDSVKRN